MKTKLAVIESPMELTKKQCRQIRKKAKKRLGSEFRVLVLAGAMRCILKDL